MSVRQGNKIIASKPTIDNSVTQDSPNAVSGGAVYSALQTKQPAITGAASTITTNNLTASKAIISNASGKIDVSATTATELGYLSGVTSGVQTQINNKQDTLVSGTNIKTINSGSILGSGNIDVLVNEATPASSLGVGYTTVNTTYTDSINIGNGAQVGANNALALGAFASAEGQDSIAIYSSTGTSHRARTTHTGNIAIGYNALAINAPYTIAIGYNAFAQSTNAIQLGTGQNASSGTMQVWTHKLLDKTTGLIPAARFADQTSATQGQVLTLDSNLDAQWTTISTMTGADGVNAGTSGLVPAPSATDNNNFLRGDGTWAAAGGGSSLPSQTGNAGKFLTTDGTDASWSDKPLVNTATGTNALTVGGVASTFNSVTNIGVNSQAYSYNNVLAGYNTSAYRNSIAIGSGASAGNNGSYKKQGNVVIGYAARARADYVVALGYNANADANGAIQISATNVAANQTNSDANTFKVANANGNFEIMSADGTIPEARLADTTSATAGRVLTLDSNLDAQWADIDYVVEHQEPNAGNNYTWYRKYKSGWVEQGGIQTGISANGTSTVTLPIEMADTNYFVTASMHGWSSSYGWYTATSGVEQRAGTDIAGTPADMTTTTFVLQSFSTHNWYVCGMAA